MVAFSHKQKVHKTIVAETVIHKSIKNRSSDICLSYVGECYNLIPNRSALVIKNHAFARRRFIVTGVESLHIIFYRFYSSNIYA